MGKSDVCDILLLHRSDKAGKMLAEVLLKGLQGHRYIHLEKYSNFWYPSKILNLWCSYFQACDSRGFLIRSESDSELP